MALTTDARNEIVLALQLADLPAFPYVPATVSLPAVIVTPRDPYILPDRIGATLTYTAGFRLSVLVQALDNATALAACEDLIDRVIAALPDGVTFIRCGPPLMDNLGAQGDAFVAEMDVSAHVTGPAPTPAPPTIPDPPGTPVADNWLETSGSWQFDLTWPLSPNDGGSPILRHAVMVDGEVTVVDGNTGSLGAVFSDHYPIDVYVEAVNAVGNSMPSHAQITNP